MWRNPWSDSAEVLCRSFVKRAWGGQESRWQPIVLTCSSSMIHAGLVWRLLLFSWQIICKNWDTLAGFSLLQQKRFAFIPVDEFQFIQDNSYDRLALERKTPLKQKCGFNRKFNLSLQNFQFPMCSFVFIQTFLLLIENTCFSCSIVFRQQTAFCAASR